MTLLETAAVAFAMFSAVPVPQPVWNEKNMRYALCAFPLVGVVCGLAWWGWAALAARLSFPLLLRAAGLCLAPVLVTGGIHLDGYADTCDALASCAAPEKKQEILKDPHCGAFAVIRLCTYFTAYLGLCAAVDCTPRAVLCMGLGFVLERALSGYAIAAFPLAKNTGLAHTFATGADRTAVRRALLVLCALAAAGMAAHLAGAVAANTTLPVIGIPCKSNTLDGIDALLSTVQMPSGIPVATVAINGGANAALLSAQILALGEPELAKKLEAKRAADAKAVLEKNAAVSAELNSEV